MPLPVKPLRQKVSLDIEISLDDVHYAAAGSDPVFGDFTADDYSAFVRFQVCRSLPMVCGPESVSGAIFGVHPAVIARSFHTLRNKQLNNGHRLKMFGADRNAFIGCVLQVAFPEEPEGGWVVPATVDEAPSIAAFGTLFKQDEAVAKILGEHLGGKKKWSVSMELYFIPAEVGIYDSLTNETFDRKSIPSKYKPFLNERNDGSLEVRRNSRNPPLVLALGGVSGRIWFSGTGFTTSPAEATAGIDMLAAEKREGMMVCCLSDGPSWVPGMQAQWVAMAGGYGRGVVTEVHEEGPVTLHGKTFIATREDPVLRLKLPSNYPVLRRASFTQKKS